MLEIYDTFAQEKKPFTPKEAGKVSLYVCGITVYDECHIGHARVSVAFDVIVRYLSSKGLSVNYVRNITDIDDKIIKRAQEQDVSVTTLTERYIEAMNKDFSALGIASPTQEPRATAHMPEIVALIEQLIEKKHAYVANNGDVYYNVASFDSYGTLSHQSLEDLQAGVRVAIEEAKNGPLDFVLWKQAKEGEPSWPSPWGEGRPGWHIECSAMATKCLGHGFDIHGGGKDLLFPHHENERAQSEGATETTFSNQWMHVGFVQIDKEKMSKSLDNFFTISEVLKTVDPEVVRYFLIASHYRSPVNYTQDNLTAAKEALTRLYGALRGITPSAAPEEASAREEFCVAMDDDFNTPQALSVLFDLSHQIHKIKASEPAQASALAGLLLELGDILGILKQPVESFFQGPDVLTAPINAKIEARELARAEKNWALADQIRAELVAEGIVLEDVDGKTIWRRGKERYRGPSK